MPDFFHKQKFPTAFFVIAAISTFIFLPLFFIVLKITLAGNADTGITPDKYYFKKFEEKDPLITKTPDLKDILNGPIIGSNDPSQGPSDARVTIVEYSDFECKFCKQQEAVIKRVVSEYKGKVRLIWKDYPENDKNSASWMASIAARCAQSQRKFWDYHDELFGADDFDTAKAYELAEKIGLDKNLFESCMNGTSAQQLVKDNIKEADALGITGVPFIYVNNQEIMGEVSYEELKGIVEEKLK